AAHEVAPIVTEWLGAPKDFMKVMQLPDSDASPFESGTILLTPVGELNRSVARVTTLHQLSHSAFSSRWPWIYEGIAYFMQAVYRERQDGRKAALELLGVFRQAMNKAQSLEDRSAATPHSVSRALIDGFDQPSDRSKAAYAWWMLRDMLGEDVLKK